jgi:hypothetical protein
MHTQLLPVTTDIGSKQGVDDSQHIIVTKKWLMMLAAVARYERLVRRSLRSMLQELQCRFAPVPGVAAQYLYFVPATTATLQRERSEPLQHERKRTLQRERSEPQQHERKRTLQR